MRTLTTRPRALDAREVLRSNVILGRAKARVSQEELAERSGVSRPTISRIERAQGDVGIDVVERIATALGVTIAELFVPARGGGADERELAARAADSDSEFVDARDFVHALDEADGNLERYSRAGRPLAR